MQFIKSGIANVIVLDSQCIRTDILHHASKMGIPVVATNPECSLGLPDRTGDETEKIVDDLLSQREAGVLIFDKKKIAEVSAKLSLRHVVITSVTRDDLPDKGARQFARTIDEVRRLNKGITVEVLTPDFSGSVESIRRVAEKKPEIYNHNIETVPRLYKKVRPQADYKRSLELLKLVKEFYPAIITKSGMMVGLGEEKGEVIGVMKELRNVGCDVLTIGQYLMPTKNNLPVIEYVEPEVFEFYKQEGVKMGFKQVESGPFVRSSYHAARILK